MNKYELKYKWEENKHKVFAGAGVLAGVGLVIGGIYLMTNKLRYDDTAAPNTILAEHLITINDEDALDLYNVEDEKKVATLDLPKNYMVRPNQNLNETYVFNFDESSLSMVDIDGDNLDYQPIHTFGDKDSSLFKNLRDFQVSNEQFAFLDSEAFYVLDKDRTFIELKVDEEVEAWTLGETGIYYSEKDHLYYKDFNKKDDQVVEIGDTTTHIQPNGRFITIHNAFGSGMNESIVLRMDSSSLKIEEMHNLESAQYVTPITPADENQMVLLDIERTEEGTALQKQLIIKNLFSVEDEETNEAINLELAGEGNYLPESVLVSNGFLYNLEDGYIGISELRNGRQYKTVPVDHIHQDNPYFLPVYTK